MEPLVKAGAGAQARRQQQQCVALAHGCAGEAVVGGGVKLYLQGCWPQGSSSRVVYRTPPRCRLEDGQDPPSSSDYGPTPTLTLK